ncbi:MAG: PASTA domain-containing protein, partial [Actinomycetota bacterium]
ESAKAAGTVLSQNPRPGTVMSLDAPFTVVIAKPFPPKLPSLVGKTLKQVKAFAEIHGWKLVVRRETSSLAPGTIIRQSPTPGTFMRGSGTLTVIVAKKAPVESGGGDNCHPSYQGECLRPDASDYDCAGGSGNGPYYVYGTVRVVGPDVFDLDRDGDGYGCD